MASEFGLIGLAVMGENLVLNFEKNGDIPVAVYNRTFARTEEFLAGRAQGKRITGHRTLAELVAAIAAPRRILIMVKAGPAVDAVLEELMPLLSPGDIVIDGGNSLFSDTERRHAQWKSTGIHFFGMGVSGGEEGALNGPSLMPGGDRDGYEKMKTILERIAAKTDTGPCVTFCGTKGAGHFVKMVHNGIEYGDMQLIAEAYDLMRHALGLDLEDIQEVFEQWNTGRLSSFLIEISSQLINRKDDQTDGYLIDQIVDSAGQKGTGKWTTISAMELGVAIPTITAAVDARLVSALRRERLEAARVYPRPVASGPGLDAKAWIPKIESALYASKICSYAQGFSMLRQASQAFDYGINLTEVARIWKGGCIIRAVFLDRLMQTFQDEPDLPNILIAKTFRDELKAALPAWRDVVRLAIERGLGVPAMGASLAYFENYTRERLPANVIQAQRDFFGAHTYERIDREGSFHTEWLQKTP